MQGIIILILLCLLYPVRFVWQFGHDWTLSRILGWGIQKTKLELQQLTVAQQDKANRRNGKLVRRMNQHVRAKQKMLGSLTSLQLQLGIVQKSGTQTRHASKVA